MAKMNLFEISQLYNDTLEAIIDEDLDLSLIDQIEGDFKEKSINVIKFFKNLEASAAAIKEAEGAMRKRRQVMENKIKSMKEYLLHNMLNTGVTVIECPYFKASLRKNPPAVNIIDENLIPEQFKIVETTIKIDRLAIKEAGGCPGASIVQNKSLSIK